MSACPFCMEQIRDRIVAENDSVVAIEDQFPVSAGHLLIIPRRHVEDYFAMDAGERQDTQALIVLLKARITAKDATVTGFNVGTNAGASAGQTIFHAHVHLIPRRDGDTPCPRGGVRGVIPDRMTY